MARERALPESHFSNIDCQNHCGQEEMGIGGGVAGSVLDPFIPLL